MYTTEKDLLESIDKDYKFHETKEGVSDDFRNGFLSGLNQAKINILNTRKNQLICDEIRADLSDEELNKLHEEWEQLSELLLGNGFEMEEMVNKIEILA